MPQGFCAQPGDAAPHPLREPDFAALRLWAMNFAPIRAAGIAVRPAFRYTRPQVQRLRAIAAAVPRTTLLVWIFIVAVVWFCVAFAIGFVPLVPLLAAVHPLPGPGSAAGMLLLTAICCNLLSAIVGGGVIAAWIGGRLTKALRPLPALAQEPGDDELLASIRRQVVRVAIFGVSSATAPSLLAALLG